MGITDFYENADRLESRGRRQKSPPASKGGLIPIAEIKRLILEHYPCYEEDDDEDKVELEVAIAQTQRTHDLAHFRKLVEDVKASHKALKPDIIFGIELACDDILKALKGEA